MKIGIIGTGYVGLTQGVVFSNLGKNVICMDISEEKVNTLKKGSLSIYEPGLRELMLKSIKAKTLDFTTDIKKTVENCEVIFIAVGTPSQEDGSSNLHYVMDVAKEIGTYINDYKVIVDKSTVPVGTGKKVKEVIKKMMKERNVDFEFDMVSNPEFIREGKAIRDCTTPDRIVIGTENERAKKIMKKIYGVFIDNQIPFIFTNIETAEMIKYASNAFLAIKISFINEMALLAEKVGANIQEVAKGMGMDKRISPYFLYSGPGYGGSCFPKDTRALVKIGMENNIELKIVKAAIEVNERQKYKMVEKIIEKMGGVEEKIIGILGLSFKPDTDDIRDAPSIDIIRGLVKAGAKIQVYCPKGMKESKLKLKNIDNSISYCNNEYETVKDTEAVVLITEWKQFLTIDLDRIYNSMKDYYFFDLRNVYAQKRNLLKKFKYFGVGI